MPKYRNIKTGVVIEVLEGTKIYDGHELVRDCAEKALELPKRAKSGKKFRKKSTLEKETKITGAKSEKSEEIMTVESAESED